jgi:L-lactate dehydrogenase (cytochrome)
MLQRLRVPANVDDVREAARRTMPKMVFDYVDGGSGSELTMRANREAFDEVVFRPRMAVPVLDPDLTTTVLGIPLAMPVLLSPCGGLRAMHPDGEAGVARAAHRAGVTFALSTAAGTSIEDVAAASDGPLLFQLYFLGGRAGAERLIDRAEHAGFRGLVVTVDTNVAGTRARDVRNGMTAGPYVNARNIVRFAPQVATRPGWLLRFVRDGMNVELANTKALGPGGSPMDPTDAHMAMFAEPPTWSDIEWIRERWRAPLAVKGVLTADDARRAADLGADAVIVSNHGGRQLDGAPATMRALPEVVDAVGDRVEVLLDSGARRGSDVVRALAVGARAVMFGRAYVYGLGAGGEAGVDTVLRLLRDDLRNTMQLLGCDSVRTLDRGWLAAATTP